MVQDGSVAVAAVAAATGVAGGDAEQSLYVVRLRGLPYSAKTEELEQFFGNEGLGRVLITKRYDGLPSGEGYVTFTTKEAYNAALTKDRKTIGHRYIEVFASSDKEFEQAELKSASAGSTTSVHSRPTMPSSGSAYVRLRGLPYGCTADEIIKFFEGLNIVPDGVVLSSEKHGPSAGEAFVVFATPEDGEKAKLKHMKNIQHRYIEVFPSTRADLERFVDSANQPSYGGGGGHRGGRGSAGGDYYGGGGYGSGGGGGYNSGYGAGDYGGGYGDYTSGPMNYQGAGYGSGYGQSAGGGRMGGYGYAEHRRPSPYDRPNAGGGYGGGYGAQGGGGYGAGGYDRPNAGAYGGPGYGGGAAAQGGYQGRFNYPNSAGGGGGQGGYGGAGEAGGYPGGAGGGPMRRGDMGGAPGSAGGGGGMMAGGRGFSIRMRGIPYRAQEYEIFDFFRPARPQRVEIIYESSGRPSGEARVFFNNREEVDDAMQRDRQYMGARYVELFPEF